MNAAMITMGAFPRETGSGRMLAGERAWGNPTRPRRPRAMCSCMFYIYSVEDRLGIPDLRETC